MNPDEISLTSSFFLRSTSLGVLLLLFVIADRHHRCGVLHSLGLPMGRLKDLFPGFLFSGTVVLAALSTGLLLQWAQLSIQSHFDIVHFGLWLLSLSMGAFYEEMLFRGGLLRGLLRVFPRARTTSLVLSALLFAVAHVSGQSIAFLAFFGYCIGGFVYALAYVRTGSIWLPLGIHLGWNALQGLLTGSVSGHARATVFQMSFSAESPASWILGGSYGLEAGILGLLARCTIGWWVFRKFDRGRP